MNLKTFLTKAINFLKSLYKPTKPVRQYKRLHSSQKRKRLPHLIAKYGMKCFWCGCELTPETLTVDHYIPLAKGGTNKIKNLRLACTPCNNGRGDAMPEETIALLNSKRRCIEIPSRWQGLKYRLGQKTPRGQIVGAVYHPPGTWKAFDGGECWTYFVLSNDQALEVDSYHESELEGVNHAKL